MASSATYSSIANWERDPLVLISKRVRVLWSEGKTYWATVVKYDRATGEHELVYDDGERKAYDMATKTFWHNNVRYGVAPSGGSAPLMLGAGAGTTYTTPTYYSAYSWKPFVSKTPNVATLVTFHCLVQPKWIREGESVHVQGNPEAFGAAAGGLPMEQDPLDPRIWHAELMMPFTLLDSSQLGMFKFRYKIVTATGEEIPEGQLDRSETRILPHLYHAFRSNYQHNRFRGTLTPAAKDVIQAFARHEIACYEGSVAEGAAPAAAAKNLISRFANANKSIVGGMRGYLEEVVNEVVRDAEAADGRVPKPLLLGLLGMIGTFGRSTSERVYTGSYGNLYNTTGGAKTQFRTAPKPSRWCFHLLEVDVPDWYANGPKAVLGNKYAFALTGMLEAVDRVSEHGSMAWLRIWPLLRQHKALPKVKTPKDEVAQFEALLPALLEQVRAQDLISDQLEAEDRLHAAADAAAMQESVQQALVEAAAADAATATVTDAPGPSVEASGEPVSISDAVALTAAREAGADGGQVDSAGNDDNDLIGLSALEFLDVEAAKNRDPDSLALARHWLAGLVRYAPYVDHLQHLCVHHAGRHLEALIPALAKKLQSFWWSHDEEFDSLDQLLDAASTLRCPAMAAAFLRSDVHEGLKGRTLRLVTEAIREQAHFQDGAAEAAEASSDGGGDRGGAEESKGAVDADAAGETEARAPAAKQGEPELKGQWLDLNTAAKDWLRRYHAEEPKELRPPKEDTARIADDWYAAYTQPKKNKNKNKKKGPTPAQIEAGRLRCLRGAMVDVGSLLGIPFFEKRCQSGLFFEFRRCWFMKGGVRHVLSALCHAMHEDRLTLGRPLEAFLRDCCARLVVEAALGSEAEAAAVLEILTEDASGEREELLYVLAMASTYGGGYQEHVGRAETPPLAAVLRRETLWAALFSRNVRGSPGHRLADLVDRVRGQLTQVAEAIAGDALGLREVHTVLDGQAAFLRLLNRAGAAKTLPSATLAARATALRAFDAALAQLQCFASFWCGCGVRIAAEVVKQQIEDVRGRYPHMVGAELPGALDGAVPPDAAAWLFELRSSELFLKIWQQCGREVGLERVITAMEADADADEDGGLSQVANLFATEDDDDGEVVREAEAPVVTPTFERLEDVVLTPTDVVDHLLPRARAAWESLAARTLSGELSFLELQTSFGGMAEAAQVAEELRLLVPDPAPRAVAVSRLKDFLLFRRLRAWLPAILRLRELLDELVTAPPEMDELHGFLAEAAERVGAEAETQSLATIPGLVGAARGSLGDYEPRMLDFVACFAQEPAFVAWLLARQSTEEFNQLLQVVRGYNEDPRLLSSIASLVTVRTLLIHLLYGGTYEDLSGLLAAFQSLDLGGGAADDDASPMWHLANIVNTFEGLVDVFEKQTKSPGIKSCYDLAELLQVGFFVLEPHPQVDEVVRLELRDEDRLRVEKMDYLLDLRSKLLMTEIPPEVEQEIQAGAMVETFVAQLQVLGEMRDLLAALFRQGHIAYQTWRFEVKFSLDGRDALLEQRERLRDDADAWAATVKAARDRFYFLNAYTMRELLRMRACLEACRNRGSVSPINGSPSGDAAASGEVPPPAPVAADLPPAPEDADVGLLVGMGFAPGFARAALRETAYNIENAVNFCLANAMHAERIAREEDQIRGGALENRGDAAADAAARREAAAIAEEDPKQAFEAMLYAVTATLGDAVATQGVDAWAALNEAEREKDFLKGLGRVLDAVFRPSAEASETAVSQGRKVTGPSAAAANAADLLVMVEDEDASRLPVFVTVCDQPSAVISTVLSVYYRRRRLPEPSEVLFCSASHTILEDLELLVRRFLRAKTAARGDHIFCVADLHQLSYTQQCRLVDMLRSLLAIYGTENAATLLLVAGRPRQLAVAALSSQRVELPPLAKAELRRITGEALQRYAATTTAVAATINGGGKSHFIAAQVAAAQARGEALAYRKVLLREATAAADIVGRLLESPPANASHMAFHIDIGHIIPAAANRLLFQLLVVGVLRDPESGRVYHRRTGDPFYLEVPNAPGDETRKALHLTELLPLEVLDVNADALDTRQLHLDGSGKWTVEQSDTYRFVAAYLRAQRMGKFRPEHANFDVAFDAHTEQLNRRRIFDELRRACCVPGGPSPQPSWSLLTGYARFLAPQLRRVELYPLLDLRLLMDCGMGLETFKDAFVAMLVATAKGFSLRSVPQVAHVGPAARVRPGMSIDMGAAPARPEAAPLAPGGAAEGADNEANEANESGESSDSDEPPASRPNVFGRLNDLAASGSDSTFGDDRDEPPPAPDLTSEPSTGSVRFLDASQRAQHARPAPGFGPQQSVDMAARFGRMARWDETDHPVAVFKPELGGGIAGINILALNPDFLDSYIGDALRHALEAQSIDLNPDWEKLTNAQGVELLRFCASGEAIAGGLAALESGYVLTVDNLLKMISILYRLRFGLPVVIMGETGCGKSTLIRNMCAILGYPLHVLNVHGGMGDGDIKAWMDGKIATATGLAVDLIVMLDEVNTCNSMGLFKEIVCDRSLEGQPLPENLKIICACNPYRKRTTGSLYGDEDMAGLAFEFVAPRDETNVGTGIKDPLKDLVYRVHPLPEAMIDHIYDFGSLSADTEKLYIKAMLREKLALPEREVTEEEEAAAAAAAARAPFEEFVAVFTELICAAQECIRDLHDGERSSASLRDVSRCVKVYHWFAEYLTNSQERPTHTVANVLAVSRNAQPTVRRATCLALAYCYYARLPRQERALLAETLCDCWSRIQRRPHRGNHGPMGGMGYFAAGAIAQQPPRCRWLHLDNVATFVKTLRDTQTDLVSAMNLGSGIALNEALCENLFMILVSLLNSIPIFVIGKPGSSKSLAMNLIQSNMNGDASENETLKKLPAVEVFSYQCSPLSTSAGIEQTFDAARRYGRETTGTVVVVLLDEVGLAEQSPWLPLKVLHSVLDTGNDGESLVGISNWALDPAKMNRAVHLYRPAPTVDDLSLTAEGMVQAASLRGYLQSLARAYSKVYHGQEKQDFWGLREFYSTVKAINAQLQRRRVLGEAMVLDEDMLLDAVLRNYGGRPERQSRAVVETFFDELGLPKPSRGEYGAKFAVGQLIRRNLQEPEARHLMLLTKNNAALGLLFDNLILRHDRTEIVFGSDFPLDQTDLQVCLNLQRVKLCMAEGITVVLVHGEALYESLYDLLNQHYAEYGGQLYVRLAFGASTRLCPVHQRFRVVVIVEKADAYTKLAPPLLNRFEKQVFEMKDVLSDDHQPVVQKLQRFAEGFACPRQPNKPAWKPTLGAFRAAFCGFHADLLASLVAVVDGGLEKEREVSGALAHASRGSEAWQEEMLRRCIERLMEIATPEAVCRLHAASEAHENLQRIYGFDCAQLYFRGQTHGSLAALLAAEILPPPRNFEAEGILEGEDMPEKPSKAGVRNVSVASDPDRAAAPEVHDPADAATDALGPPDWSLSFASTYAPLDPEVARRAATSAGAQDPFVVALHDLDAEADLRRQIAAFFERENAGGLLLVQCDPLAASFRRVEHAKFVIEKAVADAHARVLQAHRDLEAAATQPKASRVTEETSKVDDVDEEAAGPSPGPVAAPADPGASLLLNPQNEEGGTGLPPEAGAPSPRRETRGVHVVVLLHLARGLENRWCVSHDARWRHVFVDAVAPAAASGLPEAEQLLGRTMAEVLGELDLARVLRRSFRQALARLSYRHPRTNALLRDQIRSILQFCDDPDFVRVAKSLLSGMVSSGGYDLDVARAAEEDGALSLAGTFQAVLHHEILATVSSTFALILLHMDRNAGLALLLDPALKPVYLHLLERSFQDLEVHALAVARNPQGRAKVRGDSFEVPVDGFGGEGFVCRFPFSFYLRRAMEALRREEGLGRISEKALAQAIAFLSLDFDLGGHLDEDLLRRFVHDLVCMAFPAVGGMLREAQAGLAWSYLAAMAPEIRVEIAEVEAPAQTTVDTAASEAKAASASVLDPKATVEEEEGQSAAPSVPRSPGPAPEDCGHPTTLAGWQHRCWRGEQHLSLIFRLLDLIPAAHGPVTTLFQGLEAPLSSAFHVAVTQAFLSGLDPSRLAWTSAKDYGPWMATYAAATPLLGSLIDLLPAAELEGPRIAKTWELLQFLASLVRHVAQPLELPPAHVLSVAEALAPLELRSRGALRTLVATFADLNREIMRGATRSTAAEFVCPISLERMVDPVIAADGGTYDRRSIRAWIDRAGAEVRSPLTNLPLQHTRLVPDASLKERLQATEELDLREFLEGFVLETLLAGDVAALDVGIFEDVVDLAVGHYALPNVEERYVQPVLPSAACQAALLRELLRRPGIPALDRLAAALEMLRRENPDHEVLAMYVTVLEEQMLGFGFGSVQDAAALAAQHRNAIMGPATGSAVAYLKATAEARTALRRSALDLGALWEAAEGRKADAAEASPAEEGHDRVETTPAYAYLATSLTVLTTAVPLVRSLRLFFLKEVERTWGIGFLRRGLKSLCAAAWVKEWTESDATLLRFLGDSHLPHENPLRTLPGFAQAQEFVSAFLSSGDAESLATGAEPLRQQIGDAPAKAALLGAVFHEFCLLRIVAVNPAPLQKAATDLLAWLRGLAWLQPAEMELVGLFTGGAAERLQAWEALQLAVSPGMQRLADVFTLTPASAPADVLHLRFLAHLAAMSLAAADVDLGAVLRQSMLAPGSMAGSFLPAMPQDALKMAQEAMGGRWYRCANGHPYYVDLCGRPTELLRCMECGLPIGGTDHNLLTDNQDIGNVGESLYQRTELADQSAAGYGLRSAEEEKTADAYPTARTLGPLSCRTARLLLHAGLVLGAAAKLFVAGEAAEGHSAATAWDAGVKPLFNAEVRVPEDPSLFFLEHFLADVATLQARVLDKPLDDALLWLHALLHLGSGGRPTGVVLDLQPIAEALDNLSGDGLASLTALPTPAARKVWEQLLGLCVDVLSGTAARGHSIDRARQWFTSQDVDDASNAMALVAELKERFRPESLAPDRRAASLPSLWRHRRFFDFDVFARQLRSRSADAPLLARVLAHPEEIESLRRLPGVFRFLALLLDRYNLKIDRDTARRTTMAEVLAQAPPTLLPLYEQGFQDFAACWAACWPAVKTYGCTPIPLEFQHLEMTRAAPLSFCLPCGEDEGVCPTALLQYLSHLHNDLCELRHEHGLRHGAPQHGERAEIASPHLTASHCAHFEAASFARFLRDRCATAEGKVPLLRAEKTLASRHLGNVRALRLELRLVTYAQERHRHGGLQRLRRKIRQEPLPSELAALLRRELNTPRRAAPVRETVETVVAFLAAAAGASGRQVGDEVREMKVGDYAKSFLLLEEAGLGRTARTLQLRHLEGMLDLLSELCGSGPFARVHGQYKEALPPMLAERLAHATAELDLEALLPVFAAYVRDNLCEAHTDPETSLKASLEWLELDDTWLQEVPWFRAFPDEVRMKHAVSAFEALDGHRTLE